MSQATLHTERLTLQPLGPEHGDYLYQLDSDERVMKYIGFGKPLSESDSKIVHKCLLDTATPGTGLGCWAAFSGEKFVGWWVLAQVPDQAHDESYDNTTGPPSPGGSEVSSANTESSSQSNIDRVEFGLRIMPEFWGQGFAKEGSRRIIRHGLQDLGVNEVYGETMAVNTGSRKTMESVGMKYVRTFYNQYDTPPPGIEEGEVEYNVTRDALFGDAQ